MDEKKIAIIAVHGVGSHLPGAMPNSLANQLLENFPNDYDEFHLREFSIRVDTNALGSPPSTADLPRPTDSEQCNLQFTINAIGNGKDYQDIYSTSVTECRTRMNGKPVRIDIHELFWADLSHAGVTGGIAVLNQMMQLFMHMASLGKTALGDLISLAPQGSHSETIAKSAHRLSTCSYMLLSRPILLWNILLMLLGSLLLPLSIASADANWIAKWLLSFVAMGVAGIPLWFWLRKSQITLFQNRTYNFSLARHILWLLPSISVSVLWIVLKMDWGDGRNAKFILVLASLAVGVAIATAFIRVYDKSAPGAMTWWKWIVGLLILNFFCAVLYSFNPYSVVALLVEGCFAALAACWTLLYLANFALFVSALFCLDDSLHPNKSVQEDLKGSIETALLAACLPGPLMLSVIFAIWTAYFHFLENLKAPVLSENIHSLFPGPDMPAQQLMNKLFMLSEGQGIAYYVVILVFALIFGLIGLLPSVVAELSPSKSRMDSGLSRSLGNWLDSGFSLLSGAGIMAMVGFFVVIPIGVVRDYIHPARDALPFNAVTAGAMILFLWATKFLSGFSFKDIGKLFARLRVVIDVAVDVDNWLRQHPEGDTPRLKIMARYSSLLRHLADRGYQQVIIVAHSQGTVITLDLLRYLTAYNRGTLSGFRGIQLLTAGSPLRQLYARRFPALYKWATRPKKSQANLRTWINGYGSGDYVGRYLWKATRNSNRWQTTPSAPEFCVGAIAHTHYFDKGCVEIASAINRLISRAALRL